MDYSKVTMVEYQAKKRKIFESLGVIADLCVGISCEDCPFNFEGDCIVEIENEYRQTLEVIKAVMDYEIPFDWSKVEVDTPVLVSEDKRKWYKRYFSKWEDGKVYAFTSGRTNWNSDEYGGGTCKWEYAKLANPQNEENK